MHSFSHNRVLFIHLAVPEIKCKGREIWSLQLKHLQKQEIAYFFIKTLKTTGSISIPY